MHPLDNVIWQALTTCDQQFAKGSDRARRFQPDISPLAAFAVPGTEGYTALNAILKPKETIGVFLPEAYQEQVGWERLGGGNLSQMVLQGEMPVPAEKSNSLPEIVPLGDADSPEMLELTALTKPGPFLSRTHHLGNYFGIRIGGKLAAMAGERLKVPGYTEVSAVCTHPDHLGNGYARILMTKVMRGILDRGETPYLHSIKENTRAIGLYEKLGFKERWLGYYVILRKQS